MIEYFRVQRPHYEGETPAAPCYLPEHGTAIYIHEVDLCQASMRLKLALEKLVLSIEDVIEVLGLGIPKALPDFNVTKPITQSTVFVMVPISL